MNQHHPPRSIDQSSSINGVFDLTSHVATAFVVIGVKQPLIGVAGCDCGELPDQILTSRMPEHMPCPLNGGI